MSNGRVADASQHVRDGIGHHEFTSPARLDDAGNLALEREESQADSAKLEFAIVSARATTNLAAVAVTHLELGRPVELRILTCTSHLCSLSRSPEGHSQVLEESAALLVGPCRRHEA